MESMYVLLIHVWICMDVWAELGKKEEYRADLTVPRRRTGIGVDIGVPSTIAYIGQS
jgi:hypothetical protein